MVCGVWRANKNHMPCHAMPRIHTCRVIPREDPWRASAHSPIAASCMYLMYPAPPFRSATQLTHLHRRATSHNRYNTRRRPNLKLAVAFPHPVQQQQRQQDSSTSRDTTVIKASANKVWAI